MPPSSLMMSDAVIPPPYGKRNFSASPIPHFGIETLPALAHCALMWTSERLLAALRDAGVKNVEIARALGLAESRVSEMFKGDRRIQLDEAAKLIAEFELGDAPEAITPLTTPIARLIALHVAKTTGAEIAPALLDDLAADLRAFSAFAADRQVRDSTQAVDGFFQSLRIRRRLPAASPPLTRHRPGH